MTFEGELIDRSAETYSGFFLPYLSRDDVVLDCGCGSGSISVGLGYVVDGGRVVAFDVDVSGFGPALRYLDDHSTDSVRFLGADVVALPFNDGTFDAALCHSVLEVLPNPLRALGEILRVLVPGGVVGAASVDYGGLLLAGPGSALLSGFYEVRERLWNADSIARPRAGRDLRGLFDAAGFTDIDAQARYVSYGDAQAIRSFGQARAADCVDPWFSSRATSRGLITAAELKDMERAWRSWSTSGDSFLAFPWCHAIGRRPLIARRRPVSPSGPTRCPHRGAPWR